MRKPIEIVAHHEAGHAVIAFKLELKVRSVSIAATGGITKITWGRTCTENRILATLAGPHAQRRYAPRSHWRSRSHTGFDSGYDFDNVTTLIYDTHGKGKVAEAYWRYVEAHVEQLLEQHWESIKLLAEALLRRETLTGEEMRELFWHEFQRVHHGRSTTPNTGDSAAITTIRR